MHYPVGPVKKAMNDKIVSNDADWFSRKPIARKRFIVQQQANKIYITYRSINKLVLFYENSSE